MIKLNDGLAHSLSGHNKTGLFSPQVTLMSLVFIR